MLQGPGMSGTPVPTFHDLIKKFSCVSLQARLFMHVYDLDYGSLQRIRFLVIPELNKVLQGMRIAHGILVSGLCHIHTH